MHDREVEIGGLPRIAMHVILPCDERDGDKKRTSARELVSHLELAAFAVAGITRAAVCLREASRKDCATNNLEGRAHFVLSTGVRVARSCCAKVTSVPDTLLEVYGSIVSRLSIER